jgi:hypothetical protein
MVSSDHFRQEIRSRFDSRKRQDLTIECGELYRSVDKLPISDPWMIFCCDAMRAEMALTDRLIFDDSKASLLIGIGRMRCAHWQSTQAHRLEGTIWIYGFWTGLNYVAAASDQTQPKIEVAAITAQVEKTCAQQTSQPLPCAIWTTYLESKR